MPITLKPNETIEWCETRYPYEVGGWCDGKWFVEVVAHKGKPDSRFHMECGEAELSVNGRTAFIPVKVIDEK